MYEISMGDSSPPPKYFNSPAPFGKNLRVRFLKHEVLQQTVSWHWEFMKGCLEVSQSYKFRKKIMQFMELFALETKINFKHIYVKKKSLTDPTK